MKLSGCADYTKRRRICPAKGIRERIRRNILIRRSNNRSDVGTRCRVLRDGARRGGAIGEHRRIIGICHIDSDRDAIRQGPIKNRNRDGVGVLCFIVEGCFRLELPRCADNTKRFRIRTTQRIRERIPWRFLIRRSENRVIRYRTRCAGCEDRCADVGARCCVLRHRARRGVPLVEHRALIDIGNTDRDSNAIGQRPI